MQRFVDIVIGILLGIILMDIVLNSTARSNQFYDLGVSDTYKEAFAQGLMIKEIDKDDKVIYRWIETHKDNYYDE